jgi:nucleoside-diphosphate-sugar epimerase
VYISTSGVYGDCGGARVSETRGPAAKSARAARRVDAERACAASAASAGRHCRVSILRAPGIYAEDRLPLERLHKQLPLMLHAEDSHTNHIHAEDLGRACIAALARGRRPIASTTSTTIRRWRWANGSTRWPTASRCRARRACRARKCAAACRRCNGHS